MKKKRDIFSVLTGRIYKLGTQINADTRRFFFIISVLIITDLGEAQRRGRGERGDTRRYQRTGEDHRHQAGEHSRPGRTLSQALSGRSDSQPNGRRGGGSGRLPLRDSASSASSALGSAQTDRPWRVRGRLPKIRYNQSACFRVHQRPDQGEFEYPPPSREYARI
ncbi:hypothetical protein QUF72_07410 [Desulfobacterales bacterium HSG2]|nr:hypothetical protein [Desulfobacterales bacterium HSG2]